MVHKTYPKIRRLWMEETEWIEEHVVYIQEKIDWANLSIWKEWWHIFVWSRNQIVWDEKRKEWFNWAVQYCNSHEWINSFLNAYPEHRLYWERLVPHTIRYNDDAYRKFYLFDILQPDWTWMDLSNVIDIAQKYNIYYPIVHYVWQTSKEKIIEICKEYAGKSQIWQKWEWVVIKSYTFVNKFWNPCNSKYVTDDFKEENTLVFWWNKWEWWEYSVEKDIARKYVTPWRVLKIINKLMIKYWNLEMKYIPEIMSLTMNDVISEEMWWILKQFKNPIIDFELLNKLVTSKAKLYYISYINWDMNLFDWHTWEQQ